MVSVKTNGVEVIVKCFYEELISHPHKNEFLFSYKITIKNDNIFPIQLLKRFWFIFDSLGDKKNIEGDGVVGQMPIILPQQQYTYVSACNLTSEIGYMQGFYMMINTIDDEAFEVEIPRFEMVVPYKLN